MNDFFPMILGTGVLAVLITLFALTIWSANDNHHRYDQVTYELMDSCDNGKQSACSLLINRRGPSHSRDRE